MLLVKVTALARVILEDGTEQRLQIPGFDILDWPLNVTKRHIVGTNEYLLGFELWVMANELLGIWKLRTSDCA